MGYFIGSLQPEITFQYPSPTLAISITLNPVGEDIKQGSVEVYVIQGSLPS